MCYVVLGLCFACFRIAMIQILDLGTLFWSGGGGSGGDRDARGVVHALCWFCLLSGRNTCFLSLSSSLL